MPHRKLYPIGYVARATGLSPHVIRAWERRYRAVQPGRSETNRRLYSLDDIDRLRLLKGARTQGQPIHAASGLEEERLRRMGRDGRREARASGPILPDEPAAAAAFATAGLEAVRRLDPDALAALLEKGAGALSREALVVHLVAPLMAAIGAGWAEGRLRIAHEHAATAVVREFLFELVRGAHRRESAPRLLAAAPAGQRCELGALAVCAVAVDRGWRPTFLGADLPAEEIAAAAAESGAAVVALSVTCAAGGGVEAAADEIGRLKGRLAPGVRLYVGGDAADEITGAIAAAGGRLCTGLRAFGGELRELAESPAPGGPRRTAAGID